MTDWKEQFNEKYGKNFEIKAEPRPFIHRAIDPSFRITDVQNFIRAEVIRKLIEDIPNYPQDSHDGQVMWVNMAPYKRELRVKWL
jgi:hypothetical protein